MLTCKELSRQKMQAKFEACRLHWLFFTCETYASHVEAVCLIIFSAELVGALRAGKGSAVAATCGLASVNT